MSKEVATTVGEARQAIKEYYPEGTNAEHSLMLIALVLQSRGTSFKELTDSMKVEGSPFLKLPTRS